jgi:hypothetical protein
MFSGGARGAYLTNLELYLRASISELLKLKYYLLFTFLILLVDGSSGVTFNHSTRAKKILEKNCHPCVKKTFLPLGKI